MEGVLHDLEVLIRIDPDSAVIIGVLCAMRSENGTENTPLNPTSVYIHQLGTVTEHYYQYVQSSGGDGRV